MSSIKLSYVVYVGQDPNKKLLVVNRTKTPKPDNWRENPHVMMMSSCTCVHWVTPWGGEGRGGRGGRLPSPYLMSGCLTLWGKLHHHSLFIYTKFQGNLLVFDGQVKFDLYMMSTNVLSIDEYKCSFHCIDIPPHT